MRHWNSIDKNKQKSCSPTLFLIASSISYSWHSSHPLAHCWQYLQTEDGPSLLGLSTNPSPIIQVAQCYLWGSIKERNTGNTFPQVFSTNHRKIKSWKDSHQIDKMLVSCWGKRNKGQAAKSDSNRSKFVKCQ